MNMNKILYKGSHPDSLYRVAAESNSKGNTFTRVLRILRWPLALVSVCIALAVFVYFLMPDNLESSLATNVTVWEPPVKAGIAMHTPVEKKIGKGIKSTEIDFYDAGNNKKNDLKILDIPPFYPTHLTPEVQYGNEKAESENRMSTLLEVYAIDDATLKPHITQKPEKPLAIYLMETSDATTASTETITRTENVNDFENYDEKHSYKQVEDYTRKMHPSPYKEYAAAPADFISDLARQINMLKDMAPGPDYPEVPELSRRPPPKVDVNFTSGHSKYFGISIEDAERMKSTTQSALYNTRVSPTLPTWRDRDDSTTKKYPTNIYSDVQCKSTHMALCRGILPYDLAGTPVKLGDVEMTSLMSQIEYLVATNCSDRVKHFVCALLEPECSPPPHPTKLPCYNLCKAIVDNCDGHIPRQLLPAFDCKKYTHANCVAAKSPCYTREFPCGNGTCIPQEWICDGRKDCADGEDEQKCKQCDSNEFKCPAGGCILNRWVCDGYRDCPGGEDESKLKCGTEHVIALSDNREEPGEEAAGSAPPAIATPFVPVGPRKQPKDKLGDDNSKELLVTSYSNNLRPSMKSFTPSPNRLLPYNFTSQRNIPGRKKQPAKSTEVITNSRGSSKQKVLLDNDSFDASKADETIGLLDDVDQEDKIFEKPVPKSKPKEIFIKKSQPAAKQQTKVPVRGITLRNGNNKIDVVIDGAALLRKAAAAAKSEADQFESYKDTYSADYMQAGGSITRSGNEPSCPSGELRCVDGHCITLAQLCDGNLDCSDHADEDNCFT